MAKKKGKKGKGKKVVNKDQLSNREREIFLITIDEVKHKIAWRNHMLSILDKDIKLYQDQYKIAREDKMQAVDLLEKAIVEEKEICEKITRVLPEAENRKRQVEADGAHELASKLMKIQQEKFSNEAELESLRKKLYSLESYSVAKVEKKIKDIQKQISSEDLEDNLLKKKEHKRRREEAFKCEMKDILVQEAESMQAKFSGQLDETFERITEETRWWANQANGLRIAVEHLETINSSKQDNIRSSQKELKQRRKKALQTSHEQQEQKTILSDLFVQNRELENKIRANAEREASLLQLKQISESTRKNCDSEEGKLITDLNQMEENENEIIDLEQKLCNEVCFGTELTIFIAKAQKLLLKEAKHSLILTYNGPPPEKKVPQELGNLFSEATKFIYNRGCRSLI